MIASAPEGTQSGTFEHAHHLRELAQQAAALVHARVSLRPDTALILGSGLGEIAESAQPMARIATRDLPGYPASTVEGHSGSLIWAYWGEIPVLFVQGRVHFYEGYSIQKSVYPVHLLHALGVRNLILTNAAGGLNPLFRPGDLMLIRDHIAFGFTNPLRGLKGAEAGLYGARIPYDPDWSEALLRAALLEGIPLREGTYLWTRGPSYETPAEVRMFRRFGADAVGMSTVPEALQARFYGMRVVGLSAITNLAAGLSARPLAHEEVMAQGRAVRDTVARLLLRFLQEVAR
ncbi:MAG: purine-nucleoside phosphorylase [Bacteroidetes bacterium]|nr:purine-nucleoside phosphorylase [Rhodothermia bacterium]MCS7155730.1 purine-nucleoside phosphorylase [Bacteroidota bacterium]MCX7906169.1 purine-nucleoside phosphorylase [Bacteroidota bacterium]MDW8138297.1 purine-nucleoside phosphorylase [Bacteroidota bacterium]MDW8285981.1 purine-nucleoside phosphorylase [Bacteroidota bacterium]